MLTIYQTQRLERSKSILHYLGGENQSITDSDEMLKDLFDEMEVEVEKIEPEAEVKGSTTKGITDEKRKAKKDLAVFYAVICGKAFVFCSKAVHNKEVLKVEFDFTEGKIFKKKDEDIISFATRVNELITVELLPLPAFAKTGITAAKLTEGTQLKVGFEKFIGEGGSVTAKKTAANEEIEDILEGLDELIVQMERTILEFKDSNPAFYNGFVAVNKIDNANVRHTAVGGDVTKDGAPVAGALVKVREQNKSDETDLLGRYDIEILKSGLVEVVCTHPEFGELKKVVQLKKGRGIEVDFEY